MTIDKSQIRNAATVIVIRDRHENRKILMGQRGAKAAFMPNKFVFPGGAVDAGDADIPLATPLPVPCRDRLAEDADAGLAHALAVAGVRELWEETGLILGQPGVWPGTPPDDWKTFAARGYVPHAAPLQFVFRALTPPVAPAALTHVSFWSMPTMSQRIWMISMRPVTSFRTFNGSPCQMHAPLICPSSPRSCWPRLKPARKSLIRQARSRFSRTTMRKACSCACAAIPCPNSRFF